MVPSWMGRGEFQEGVGKELIVEGENVKFSEGGRGGKKLSLQIREKGT